VLSGHRDLNWIAEQFDEEIEAVEPQEPTSQISRRASSIGLNYERAVARSADDAERANAKNPIASAIRENAYRLDRIAATENSIAFSSGRREFITASVINSVIKRSRVVQVWFALLDACRICQGLNGERVQLGGSWNGQLPGYVHARCRCIDSYEVTEE